MTISTSLFILVISTSINGAAPKNSSMPMPSFEACKARAMAMNDITQIPGKYEILTVSCKPVPVKTPKPEAVYFKGAPSVKTKKD
jgi:hypothetical protein